VHSANNVISNFWSKDILSQSSRYFFKDCC
jgi:hypothetical protein